MTSLVNMVGLFRTAFIEQKNTNRLFLVGRQTPLAFIYLLNLRNSTRLIEGQPAPCVVSLQCTHLSIRFNVVLIAPKSGRSSGSSDQHLLIRAASSMLHPLLSYCVSKRVGRNCGFIIASLTKRYISSSDHMNRISVSKYIDACRIVRRSLISGKNQSKTMD